MEVVYIDHYGTDLTVVNAARVSFDKKSEWEWEVQDDPVSVDFNGNPFKVQIPVLSEKDEKLVHYLAKSGHTSCFEHMGATLKLKVPIFIARQIQRHRTFSYNEISRRYVDSPPEFFWPDKWRGRAKDKKQGSSDTEVTTVMLPKSDDEWPIDDVMIDHISYVTDLYNNLLAAGVAPEQARMILPQNMYTEFYMSGNLRAWEHFLKLRLDGHAQVEVQVVAQQALAILQPLFPVSMKALMNV